MRLRRRCRLALGGLPGCPARWRRTGPFGVPWGSGTRSVGCVRLLLRGGCGAVAGAGKRESATAARLEEPDPPIPAPCGWLALPASLPSIGCGLHRLGPAAGGKNAANALASGAALPECVVSWARARLWRRLEYGAALTIEAGALDAAHCWGKLTCLGFRPVLLEPRRAWRRPCMEVAHAALR